MEEDPAADRVGDELRLRAPPAANELAQSDLLQALRAVRHGVSVHLPLDRVGVAGEIAEAFNDIVELDERTGCELRRVSRLVGRQGQVRQRASLAEADGGWARNVESVNLLIESLTAPMIEVSRVVGAVAEGDLSKKITSTCAAGSSSSRTPSTPSSTSSTPSPRR